MKLFIVSLISVVLLTSCGRLFTNISSGDTNNVINENRDYILINKTPFNALKVYVSRESERTCNSYKLIATMQINAQYPFHVSPGETVYILYCTPDDVFCTGCRVLKLIGNSENQGNNVNLDQN